MGAIRADKKKDKTYGSFNPLAQVSRKDNNTTTDMNDSCTSECISNTYCQISCLFTTKYK